MQGFMQTACKHADNKLTVLIEQTKNPGEQQQKNTQFSPASKYIPNTTYCAFVWLLPRVPPHVDQQHVLSLERLPLANTPLPVADKLLLAVSVDVVRVDVGDQAIQVLTLGLAPRPPALVVVRLFHTRVAVVDPLLDAGIMDDAEFGLKFAVIATAHHGCIVHGVGVH